MDCDLARALMAFAGPGELGEGARDLEAHLAGCPACAAAWARRAAFDASVGAAMRAVEVPAGGRRRAAARVRRLARLRALRAWGRATACGLAAVAALAVGAGVYHRTRPNLDTDALVIDNEHVLDSPEQVLRRFLARHDWPEELPAGFDPDNLAACGTQTVQGREVPALVFAKFADGRAQRCTLYLIGREQFQTGNVRPTAASLCFLTPLADPRRPGRVWAAVHTTPDLAPFLRP